jgi:hypothetical protein
LTGGDDFADENGALLAAEGMGPPAREALRVQEGAGGRGAQACSDTPRDVEDEHGFPLERKRSMSNMFS